MHAHTHSVGAVRYVPPSSDPPLTVQGCLEHCQRLTGTLMAGACLAVDVQFIPGRNDSNSSSVVCWVHTDLSRLTHKYRHNDIIQYVIVRCPQQQGVYTPCV